LIPEVPVRCLLAALAVASALLAAACASTAPHTGAAMAINGSLAAGAAAASRASGGCWAVCTGGLVCNPATGWCEKPKAMPLSDCPPGAEQSDARCRPWPQPTVVSPVPASGGALGISPATGSTPPAPADSTPGGPPRP
jgi:hypothetical protein